MLPPSKLSSEEADGHPDEEGLRETYVLVIRLIWIRSQVHLEPLDNELELLRAALSFPSSSQPQPSEDTTWRLDPAIPTGGPDGRGPLLDSNGRVRMRRSKRDYLFQPRLHLFYFLATATIHYTPRECIRQGVAQVECFPPRP